MSEYWKSTPRYWCKYCAVYVRDTKLERANHESTGKHQGAMKRSLRDLHRNHDRDEQDKERAKREIERLNGVVAGRSVSSSGSAVPSTSRQQPPAPPPTPALSSEASLKRQREQLAELGVAIPSSFRPEMAMPGEWTVTSTRVVQTRPAADGAESAVEARASGVRKREENEDEKEEEAAVRGLFKKPRRWGRDSKAAPEDLEEAAELDALLSGSLAKKQPAEDDGAKKEEEEEKNEGAYGTLEPAVKKEEPDAAESGIAEMVGKSEDTSADIGAVVFKKRKPKGLRTK